MAARLGPHGLGCWVDKDGVFKIITALYVYNYYDNKMDGFPVGLVVGEILDYFWRYNRSCLGGIVLFSGRMCTSSLQKSLEVG